METNYLLKSDIGFKITVPLYTLNTDRVLYPSNQQQYQERRICFQPTRRIKKTNADDEDFCTLILSFECIVRRNLRVLMRPLDAVEDRLFFTVHIWILQVDRVSY